MGLLDELFAAGNTPWAQSKMAEMLGQPVAPQDLSVLTQRMGLGSHPQPTPAVAPVKRPETELTAQSAPAAPPRPNFDAGSGGSEYLSAFLQGIGGPLGGIGKAMATDGARQQQVQFKNDTYDWLLKRGVDADTAKIAVQDPSVAKAVIGRALGIGKNPDIEQRTKGLPAGHMWNDPNDPSKGASLIPGVKEKPDPIEKMLLTDQVKQDSKTMADLRKSGDTGRDLLDKLTQLRSARAGVSYEGGFFPGTRTFLGKNLPDSPIPGVGLPGIPSQEEAGKAEQVESLATDIQLKFTEKTKGAISNREMELFGRATPGMSMSDEGAKGVMDGFEAGALRTREKPKFYEAYRRQNGSLDGADAAWDSFVESKPVLVDDGKGGFKVNAKNATSWSEFVGGPPAQSGAQPKAQAAPPVPGARQAADGNFYVEDPNRPGKYLMVSP